MSNMLLAERIPGMGAYAVARKKCSQPPWSRAKLCKHRIPTQHMHACGQASGTCVQQELCALVDEQNNVVDAIPRNILVKNRLLGRGSYCLVLNPRNELFVNKRSPSKDVWPGRWDTVISGVVLADETYEACIIRELAEELGINQESIATGQLTNLGQFRWQDPYCDVWGCAFVYILPDALTEMLSLQEEEVETGDFMDISKVKHLLNIDQFTPVGKYVLDLYLNTQAPCASSNARV